MAFPWAAASFALNAGRMLFSGIAGSRAAARQRRFDRARAADAIERGEEEVEMYANRLAQLKGQQRVGAAAQGLDTNFGSVKAIREQTERIGAEDMERIRTNARREAWGIRTQANINYRIGMNRAVGDFASAAGELISEEGREYGTKLREYGGTLLSRVGDAWQRYRLSRDVRRNPLYYFNLSRFR